MPPAGASCDTHAVPVLVKTFPAVPGEESPVPPLAAASMPDVICVAAMAIDVLVTLVAWP